MRVARWSAIGAVVLTSALASCSPIPSPLSGTPSPSQISSSSESMDPPPSPIDTVTDPASDLFVDFTVSPVLDEVGMGSATFELPEAMSEVAFYVTCSPIAEYRIDAFGAFVSGSCGNALQAFGSIPVRGESRTVQLSLPEETMFNIVGIERERPES